MPSARSYDVLIVGAGLEGLLLGNELVRGGQKVAIVERRTRVGGRYHVGIERGFALPQGLHLARYGTHGPLGESLFRQGDETRLRELGKSYTVSGSGVRVLPLGLGLVLKTGMIGLRDRLRLFRLLLHLRSAADPAAADELDAWMQRQGIQGRLAELLRHVAGSMLMRAQPGRLAAREVLAAYRRALDLGVTMTFPAEGWGALVRAAEARFLALGGTLCLEWEAAHVETRRTRVQGLVSTLQDGLQAARVVWTGDPRSLLSRVETLDPAVKRSISSIRPVAATNLVLGLGQPVSTTTGLWRLEDPQAWAFLPSNIAGSMAPPGKQLLVACAPTSGAARSPQEIGDSLETRLYEVFPQLESCVEWRQVTQLPRLHGSDVGARATRAHRPPVRFSAPRGLFLVGDTCAAPGLGHEIAFAGLRRCATDILGPRASQPPPPQVALATEAGSAVSPKRSGANSAKS